ncbi:MAG: diaminopimelate epimerase [Acidimicrobiia bacterium]
MTLRVSKLHGTGNDFLVTVALDGGPAPDEAVARALCDRHRGVGANGLITLLPGSDGADCTMELRNADGGIAEMSGNGIRCLAWVAKREGLGSAGRLVVDTGGGRRDVTFGDAGGGVETATVDMGPVTFEPAEIPLDAPSAFDLEAEFHGVTYRGDAAGIGNPHLVLLVDDVESARVTQHGPRLETDARFPQRTNVEFLQVLDRDRLRMRVWERGVGETLSCGTGVCAAAAVAHRRALVGDSVVMEVPGGRHTVTIGETVVLGGEVQHVFDVDVDVDALTGRST